MRGQPAKLLAERDVRVLLRAVGRHRHPVRDRVILLLSLKAGLRAGEIAALTWCMIERADGRIGFFIELPGSAHLARPRTDKRDWGDGAAPISADRIASSYCRRRSVPLSFGNNPAGIFTE